LRYLGEYAASDNSLQEFTARYYSVQASNPALKDACGNYAACKYRLSAK